MTSGTKSVAILIATLLLGMLLGALAFGVYQRHRFRPVLNMARPAYFTASIERILEPIDDDRREAIRTVLRSVVERMRAQRIERDRARRAHLDSVEAALLPLLTDDQRQRLREHMERHKRFVKRRGPPPHRRGKRP